MTHLQIVEFVYALGAIVGAGLAVIIYPYLQRR